MKPGNGREHLGVEFHLTIHDEQGGSFRITDSIAGDFRSLNIEIDDPKVGTTDQVSIVHIVGMDSLQLNVNSDIYVFSVPRPIQPCEPTAPEDPRTLEEAAKWLQSEEFNRLEPIARRVSNEVFSSALSQEEKMLTMVSLISVFGFSILPLEVESLKVPVEPLLGKQIRTELRTSRPLFEYTAKSGSSTACFMMNSERESCYTCCDRTAVFAGMLCSPLGAACVFAVATGLVYCYMLCHLANPIYIPFP
jgi:hypothetical protein